MTDSVISLSDFKAGASQWLKQLQDDQQAVVLTQNGRGSAVVQSYESFQRQQQSLVMLKLMTQGEADVQTGRTRPQAETFAELRRKLERRVAKRPVLWTATAHLDLQSLLEYIAEEDPDAALQVLERIEKRASTLEALAQRGRIVPELRSVGVLHYREPLERPWRIVYRLDTSRVLVLAVLDSRRDLQSLLLERLVRS